MRSVVKVYAYNSLLSSSYSRLGSGVIASFDSEGNAYVITNYHVTASGTSSNYKYYKCVLYGETTYYSAVFVGGTRTYDISVLKIEKGQGFEKTNAKPAKFSLSGTLVGQECISVGNNEGMGITASKGIVSVDSEEVTMDIAGVAGSYRVLRHDTFIGHGNSGGGLFNLNGELIGITNGGKEGTLFNYALPSALVYKVYRNIMENCLNTENQKPFTFVLGIYGTTISSNLGLDKNGNIQMIDKVKISGISSESETEKEGTLMVNDILKSVTIDGTEYEITRYYHLKEYLLNVRAGSTVTVKVSRTLPTGVEQEVSATFVINASNLSEVA